MAELFQSIFGLAVLALTCVIAWSRLLAYTNSLASVRALSEKGIEGFEQDDDNNLVNAVLHKKSMCTATYEKYKGLLDSQLTVPQRKELFTILEVALEC